MKVIFLDHDGVLCLAHNQGSRHKKWKKWNIKHGITPTNKMDVNYRFDSFDKKAIKTLNEILDISNAEIVISSDWKLYASLDELKTFYTKQGIIKEPLGVTPKLKDFYDGLRIYSDLEFNRNLEILNWLSKNQVTHWVAVDDLRLNEGENKIQNFVLCDNPSLGIKKSGIKEKIINFLI